MVFIYPLINQGYIDNPLYGPLGQNGISRVNYDRQDQKAIGFYQRYKVILKNLNGWFGSKHVLKNINLNIIEKTIVSFNGISSLIKFNLIMKYEMIKKLMSKGDRYMSLFIYILGSFFQLLESRSSSHRGKIRRNKHNFA